MEIPFLALIIQGIPESIAIVTLAFVIGKADFQWSIAIAIGVILALIAYLLRLFPITFGIHTVILMGILFVILIQFKKVPLLQALRASLISYLTLIIVEYFCFTFLTKQLGISFETYLTDVTVRILISLPQVFLLFIIAYIILKIRTGRVAK